jgi:hypothetical protein
MDREGNFDTAEESFQHFIDDKMGIDHTWSDADYTRIDTEINK